MNKEFGEIFRRDPYARAADYDSKWCVTHEATDPRQVNISTALGQSKRRIVPSGTESRMSAEGLHSGGGEGRGEKREASRGRREEERGGAMLYGGAELKVVASFGRCYADDGSAGFEWADWRPRPFDETIIYEMHVGSFTPEGTLQVPPITSGHARDLSKPGGEDSESSCRGSNRRWGPRRLVAFCMLCLCDSKEVVEGLPALRLRLLPGAGGA